MGTVEGLLARTLRIAGWAAVLLGLSAAIPASAYDVPKLNTLAHFVPADYPNLGNFELSRLLQASDGELYGVSAYGGASDQGYVYRVSRSTGQITHLHDFNYQDGSHPRGALIQASDGYLYGTTESGGANQSDWCYAGKYYNGSGCGTLFRVALDGSQFAKLHDFYVESDGYQASPATGVVQAGDGNFYGMAVRAFPESTTSLFKMTPGGSVSVHHLFATDSSEGYLAYAGLLKGSDGRLYGTTGGGGGPGGCGVLFSAGLDGSFQRLHVFTGAPTGIGDGCVPWSPLMQGQDGSFYGTTLYGGYQQNNCRAGGCGTVYKITPGGVQTILHRFTATAGDGEYPQGDGLVQVADGTLYGATGGNPYGDGFGYVPYCYVGGGTTFGCGTLFKIDSAGTFTQLFAFGDGDGAYGLFPHGSLTLAGDGNLYGTAFDGGGWGYGTVFRLLLNAATPILSVDSFTPAGGPTGTSVVVRGNGFTGTSQLTFGGGTSTLPAPFVVVSDNEITTLVPAGVQTSAIGVTAPRGTTYAPTLFYVKPVIDSITPAIGRPGSGVTLLGAHFDGLTSITFGGVPATQYSYVTGGDTAINVKVPLRAKTGPIVVSNPGGSAQSPTFTVKRGRNADDEPVDAALAAGEGNPAAFGKAPIRCVRAAPAVDGSVAAGGGCGPRTSTRSR